MQQTKAAKRENMAGILRTIKAEEARRRLLGGDGIFQALPPKACDIQAWLAKNKTPIIDASHNNYSGQSTNTDMRVIRPKIAMVKSPKPLQSEAFRMHEKSPIGLVQERLRLMLGAEFVLLTSSGYMANVGVLQSLAGTATPLLLDEEAHESFTVAGEAAIGASARHVSAKLAKVLSRFQAKVRTGEGLTPEELAQIGSKVEEASNALRMYRFRHNDPGSLRDYCERTGPGVVVLEGLYSVSGTKLNFEVARLAQERGTLVVLDESHSLGGTVSDAFSVAEELRNEGVEVDILTASLSKAIGEKGGMVAIMPSLIKKAMVFKQRKSGTFLTEEEQKDLRQDLLFGIRTAGPFTFTNAADVVGVSGKLDQIIESGFLSALRMKSSKVRAVLRAAKVPIESESPLIFIEVPKCGFRRSEERARLFRDWLIRERGVMGSLYLFPATPVGRAGVRFVLNNDMSGDLLRRFTEAIIEGCKAFNLLKD
ncbi:MAG: aminotransferase class I/II-fold pyridoxal phosphate-dependent enzyme [bacterium]|nr:aminotransferase class I/II-fold pyridoxal phosphate-dependent enzyme [bacterium]